MSDCGESSNDLGRVDGRVFRRVKESGESPERRTRQDCLSGETAHYGHCVNGRHKVLFKETLFTW